MSLQVEKLEHNMAKLTVEVAAEDVEKALQAAYLKQRKQINIPGFRKGKVPRHGIIQKNLSNDISDLLVEVKTKSKECDRLALSAKNMGRIIK